MGFSTPQTKAASTFPGRASTCAPKVQMRWHAWARLIHLTEVGFGCILSSCVDLHGSQIAQDLRYLSHTSAQASSGVCYPEPAQFGIPQADRAKEFGLHSSQAAATHWLTEATMNGGMLLDKAEAERKALFRVGGIASSAIAAGYVAIIALYASVGPAPVGGPARLDYLIDKTTVWSAIVALSVLTNFLYVPVSLALYFSLRRNRSVSHAHRGLFHRTVHCSGERGQLDSPCGPHRSQPGTLPQQQQRLRRRSLSQPQPTPPPYSIHRSSRLGYRYPLIRDSHHRRRHAQGSIQQGHSLLGDTDWASWHCRSRWSRRRRDLECHRRLALAPPCRLQALSAIEIGIGVLDAAHETHAGIGLLFSGLSTS